MKMRSPHASARTAIVWAALALAGTRRVCVEAVLGIGPEVFEEGQKLPLYVNGLESTKTQTPMDHYHVGYCKPDHLREKAETLGALLEGDREETSLYDLQIKKTETCAVLCAKTFKSAERYMFANVIRDDYYASMTVNGLPAAYPVPLTSAKEDGTTEEQTYKSGFPVGFVDEEQRSYLNNHLRITIAINPQDEEETKFHVVGFIIEPFSVKHMFAAPYSEAKKLTTCDMEGYHKKDASLFLSTDYEGEVLFTYDVIWSVTTMPWTQRWDIYATTPTENQIHWFSITNSSVIVLFLSMLVAMIMVRALRTDIQRYNAEDAEDASEETGWKLVHGDVLRPPTSYPVLFAVCIGTGVQLWTVSFLVLFFSIVRLVNTMHKGDMLTVSILIYVLTGGIAGYNAARVHRRFRGTDWLKVTWATAAAFPGLTGAIFLVLEVSQWAIGSTGAVPVHVLLWLFALWALVQMPLVFLGSYYGFKKELPPQVVRTNQIPRMIPHTPWYVDPKVAVPFAGVLPFGAVLVELVFVMTALWEKHLYFIFGFLMSVMIILTITCAEISIVMCYFQLCCEDYRWWWRSMLWSGSCAGWMFVYSVGYYFTVLRMNGFVAACLFFGYTTILTVGFFLLTGAVGYFSCQWFINVIYSSIKVD